MGQTLHWRLSVNGCGSHLSWWKLSSSLREQSEDRNIQFQGMFLQMTASNGDRKWDGERPSWTAQECGIEKYSLHFPDVDLMTNLSEKLINNTQNRQIKFCMEKPNKWLVNQLET